MARVARRSRWLLLVWLVLLTLMSSGLPLRQGEAATTRVVTSLADPGRGGCQPAQCTLREAIAAAQAGDTITFDPALFAAGPSPIMLTAGELVLDQDVTVVGPGRELLKINGNGASRVFRITAGAVASIEKVTIRRGAGITGGGLYNEGTLTLRHSTVSGSTAALHGGGLTNGGTLTIIQSTVSGNSTNNHAGGIFNVGTLTLIQSTVSGNRARTRTSFAGGGIENVGTLTLIQSTVSGNRGGFGGGIANNPSGTLTLDNSTVRGNSAVHGGGIWNYGGTLTLRHSTVRGNTASRSGGGLTNAHEGMVTLRYSTVSGNTATIGGGLRNGGTLTLDRSTVSGNTADYGGGGLHNFGRGRLTLSTTIVAGNMNIVSIDGPDCYQKSGTLQALGHNLTGAGTGCPNDPSLGDVTVDPATVFTQVLGPLQDNGGATFTHALLPGSPALDAGDPATCGGTDQRGVPRPQGAGCDIGAFEREEE